MPSLKDIRRRIGSVKNTQKITRAMKLVSAAKFARANTAVVNARPYSNAFDAMVERIVALAGDEVASPLLEQRDEKKSLFVVLGTDRGFCGSLNSNLFKFTMNQIAERRKENIDIELMPWGKRSKLFAAKLKFKSVGVREKVLEKPSYHQAKELADELIEKFTSGEYDRVYICFVEFKSALSQQATIKQLLPVGKPKADETTASANENTMLLVEPSPKELLEGLLRRVVASTIFKCMLEGAASEHGARMTAMDSATNNAQEVLRRMKIEYNRARQAAITKELIEITSGAQAL